MFSRTNMRFPNLFLCDIIAPWSSQTILFTFLFHEGDLKSSAGRVWVTRPALFVFTCLPVRPASRRRSVPVSHPLIEEDVLVHPDMLTKGQIGHEQPPAGDRLCAEKSPCRKIRDTLSCVSYSLVRAMGLEPTRPYGHKHLKLACLPIPARSHAEHLAIITKCPCLSRGRRKNPRLAPRSFLCYNCSSTCPMGPSTVTAACAGPAPPLFTTASLCPR